MNDFVLDSPSFDLHLKNNFLLLFYTIIRYVRNIKHEQEIF